MSTFSIYRQVSGEIQYTSCVEDDDTAWVIFKPRGKRIYFVGQYPDNTAWSHLMKVYKKFKSFKTFREAKIYYLLNT